MTTQRRVRKNNKYWRERAIREEAGVDKLSEETSNKMAESYRRSYRRLEGEINALYAEILDKGLENISRTDLYNLNHYTRLRDAVAKEVKDLAQEEQTALGSLLDIVAIDTYRSNCEELGIGFDLVAKGLDFGHRLLGGFVDNQIREGNVCTFGCILEGNRFSDATGRSGNEGDLSV